MDRIEILETENIQKVFFDPEDGLFSISSSSIHENAYKLYQPVIKKLENYIENISGSIKI